MEIEGRDQALLRYFAMCGVWALSTYSACDIRCSYCITHAQGPSVPRVALEEVAGRMREELRSVPSDGVIGVGAQIDAYPNVEGRFGVTREALGALVDQDRRVLITTKGTDVARDVDLIAGMSDASVNVSLCSHDDAVLRQIEPHAPVASRRLATINRLAAAGVDVQLQIQPWIPGLTDAEALIDSVDESVSVWLAPLVVDSPAVRRTRLGRRFTQAEADDAYGREIERVASRPNVNWQRPLWLSRPEHRPPGAASEPSKTPEERNRAVIERFVRALNSGTQLQMLFDLWSPYIRCSDGNGGSPIGDHAAPGPFRDALFEAADAFDDVRFDPLELRADGDRVWARIEITGRHVRPFLDRSSSGRVERLVAESVYRFDNQGLVVEFSQDLVSSAGDGAAVGASPQSPE